MCLLIHVLSLSIMLSLRSAYALTSMSVSSEAVPSVSEQLSHGHLTKVHSPRAQSRTEVERMAIIRKEHGRNHVAGSMGYRKIRTAEKHLASKDMHHEETHSQPRFANAVMEHESLLERKDMKRPPVTVPVSFFSSSGTNIQVVTITDRPHDERLSVLERSLHAGGFTTNLVINTSTDHFSWTERLMIEQKIVQDAARHDPESVILFMDAFDVLNLGSPEEILRKFQQTGRDALFSCITYTYPHQCDGFDWKEDGSCKDGGHWGAQCPHWCRFACAGAFMGKARALAHIFAENPPIGASDDQCYYNTIFAKRSYNIDVDYRHEIFFSTTDLLKCAFERKGGRVHVAHTGTSPSIIHFDTSHPSADHIESFWIDTLHGAEGRFCGSNASCTDWCWDFNFGDMESRLTASDKELFYNLGYCRDLWPCELVYLRHATPIAILLGVVACLFLCRNDFWKPWHLTTSMSIGGCGSACEGCEGPRLPLDSQGRPVTWGSTSFSESDLHFGCESRDQSH